MSRIHEVSYPETEMQMREAGIDLPRAITSLSEFRNIDTYPCEEKKVFKETAIDEVKLQQRTTFASFSEISSDIRFIISILDIDSSSLE